MRVNILPVLPAVGLLLGASFTEAITQGEIDDIMSWVNHFDDAYGITRRTWDDTLFNNAQRTGQDNNGQTEVHHLYPGTNAQVITPGKNIGDTTGHSYDPYDNFQAAYLGWLCERPEQPQLEGKCSDVLSKTCISEVGGQTGHNDILTRSAYTRIGCAWTTNPNAAASDCDHGLWVCDLV